MISNQVRAILTNCKWWLLVLNLVPKSGLWTVAYLLKTHTTCLRLNRIAECIKILRVIMQVKPIISSLTTLNLCEVMVTSTQSISRSHIQLATPNSNIKQICLWKLWSSQVIIQQHMTSHQRSLMEVIMDKQIEPRRLSNQVKEQGLSPRPRI